MVSETGAPAGRRDCFPDVSGWMESNETPSSLPVFYPFLIFRKLEAAPYVCAEIQTDGISFPSVTVKKNGRNCLVRIGPQIFRSESFLLTSSGMQLFLKGTFWRDSYGRVKMHSTIVHQRGYLRLPAVDYYARILEGVLFDTLSLKGLPFIQKWNVPGPQKSALCLSHDIDYSAPKRLRNCSKVKPKVQ